MFSYDVIMVSCLVERWDALGVSGVSPPSSAHHYCWLLQVSLTNYDCTTCLGVCV